MKLNKCGCGGEARIDYVHSTSLDEPIYWYVQCTSCWCKIVGMTEERAVTAWNITHPKAIRLDDVREMVKECVRVGQTCDKCDNKHGDLCRALWAVIDGDNIDELTAYVEGNNGQHCQKRYKAQSSDY